MGTLDDVKVVLGMQKPPSPTIPTKKRKLLIVEDDASLAKALNEAFLSEDFEVLHADNGQTGLEAIQANKPDIVLLDLMMPVMNGKVMLRQLREIPEFKTLPVIVLTNAGEIDNIKETVDYDNAIEFLIKSNVTLEEIVTKVKRTY